MAVPAQQHNAIARNLHVRPLKRAQALFLYLCSFGKRKSCNDSTAADSADPPPETKSQDSISKSRKSGQAEPNFFLKNKRKLLVAGFVLAATFLVYVPCLQYGFVNWDDPVNVYKNPDIINISNIGSFFTCLKNTYFTHVFGNYNPLTITTFALDQFFFGLEKPGLWHSHHLHPQESSGSGEIL